MPRRPSPWRCSPPRRPASSGLRLRAGPASRAAIAALRRVVPTLVQDRALKPDVDATIAIVRSGELVAAVEAEIGPLE